MNTTIAAISTAVSASGIGIIRISGPEAMDVISRIYRSKGGKKKIKEVPTHTIHYGISSPVNVLGARMTMTRTSSTISSPP